MNTEKQSFDVAFTEPLWRKSVVGSSKIVASY